MSKYGDPEPGGLFDLTAIASELRTAEAYLSEGHTARTLIREPDIRLVIIAMKAGAQLVEHRTDETVAIQPLEGHVRVNLPEETIDLPMGRLLVLEAGRPHDVEAVVDSAFLLTLGWPPASS